MFTFRKAKKKFFKLHSYYNKRKSTLSEVKQNEFTQEFQNLREAITNKCKQETKKSLTRLEHLQKQAFPQSFFSWCLHHIMQLSFALVVAIFVRQMAFEFYMIPTGSMRPTFKEGDYVVVNKTAFSLNVPLQTGHFYFDKKQLQHGTTVVFTAENMDVAQADMMYFYIIPGKKQLVKRLVGKPGDTLYFYGGKLYGIDKNNQPITNLQNAACFANIEYIPFLQLGGKVKTSTSPKNGIFPDAIVYQMNQPVAKLSTNIFSQIRGQMLTGGKSVDSVEEYYKLWGFENYAVARILTQKQYKQFAKIREEKKTQRYDYYLELTHHPSIKNAKLSSDFMGRIRPDFDYKKSYIPLDDKAMQRIFSHMNTVRFVVENNRAYAYGRQGPTVSSPVLASIPNGTYEFDQGHLYEIGFARRAISLDKNHPLAKYSADKTALLYNLGVEFDTHFLPSSSQQTLLPSRYAYFRNEDLYLLANPILFHNDAVLQKFVKKEKTKAHPFYDQKAPILEDGSLDIAKIKRFGFVVPEKSYLVLGDNHPISGDSRDFGLVPEENFKGSATRIFFPFGNRFGAVLQPYSTWCTLPKVLMSTLLFLGIFAAILYQRRKEKDLWQ